MEDIRLPGHLINRIENRWATRMQQEAKKAWSDKQTPIKARYAHTDGARVIPVVVKRGRLASAKQA